MRRLGLVILFGCSSSAPSPDAPVTFEYVATARWTTQATPDVTSVTIDSRAVAGGETYTFDQIYASYEDALATFTPHSVVVMTTTETLTFQLTMQTCPTYMFDAPITKETDQFFVAQSLRQPVDFFSDSGSCESSDGRIIVWTARTP